MKPGESSLRSTTARSHRRALCYLLRAARPAKNLPLLLLLLSGALTAAPLDGPALAVAAATLLLSAAFMTQLNILTDGELDRDSKPHLLRWLAYDPAVTAAGMGLELLGTLGGLLALLLLGRWQAALSLLAFTALTVLYSYNFLVPRRAVALRLKAFGWGHLLVCQGAYLSLWCAGHGCGDGGALLPWLPRFLCVALSEYALFLSESAIDARDERRAGLRTFATLLGRRGSSALALIILLAASAALAACERYGAGAAPGRSFFQACAPALALRGAALMLLCLPLSERADRALRAHVPDLVFYLGRGLTLGALAL